MSGDGAALFLQIKEAGKSVLECLGPKFEGPGERVVEGQRVMQAASDVFLGWTEDEASGRDFYVRHLKNRRLGTSVSWWKNRRLGAAGVCAAARWHVRTHARRTGQSSRDTWGTTGGGWSPRGGLMRVAERRCRAARGLVRLKARNTLIA